MAGTLRTSPAGPGPVGPVGPLGLPRLFWLLCLGALINRLGAFVLTFLPIYLTERQHYTGAEAGRVLALFGLGGIVGATLGGVSSDRFGRRPTLLVGLAANAAALAGLGLAPRGPLIALAALAHGVSNGYGPAINAAVSDVAPPADRRRAFGYLYWAVNLGTGVAAMLGGLLSQRGFGWLFVGDASTSVVFALFVLTLVPETRPAPEGPARDGVDPRAGAPDTAPRERASLLSQARVFLDPRITPFALAQGLVLVVFQQAFMTLPMQERAVGLPVTVVGLVAALNCVVVLVGQPPFLRLTRGRSDANLLAFAALLSAAACVVLARATTAVHFVAGMVVISLAEVAFSGAAPAFVARVAPVDRRGTYQASYSLCWALSALAGPLLGPAVRDRWGSATLWTSCAALSLVAAGLHAVLTRRAEASEVGAGAG